MLFFTRLMTLRPTRSRIGTILPAALVLAATLLGVTTTPAAIAGVEPSKGSFVDKFRQLDEIWPTPNGYRTAAGEPGRQYWQQKADYRIEVSLDEANRRVTGSELLSYKNNSPDTLRYLWLQLDQNRFRDDSVDSRTLTVNESEKITFTELRRLQFMRDFEGGYQITRVAGGNRELPHSIVGTLMRIDLPEPLQPGASIRLNIDWQHNLVDGKAMRARSGYEHFVADGNDIFLLAQWYPRMVVYSDYEGWHNKEFLGRGEFTLEFGDYDVAITVPADHV
ncbi:MAG: hypothetical protein ACC642_01885, partial [Pseudomonadales bacterium]